TCDSRDHRLHRGNGGFDELDSLLDGSRYRLCHAQNVTALNINRSSADGNSSLDATDSDVDHGRGLDFRSLVLKRGNRTESRDSLRPRYFRLRRQPREVTHSGSRTLRAKLV